MGFTHFDSCIHPCNHHPKQAKETCITTTSSLLLHSSQFLTSEATTV